MGYKYNEESFFESIKSCDFKAIELFFVLGIDLNIINKEGKCPLAVAINTGSEEMVNILIEHGADINSEMGMLLSTAVNENKFEIAKLLLKNGANPNIGWHDIPIITATRNNNFEIVKLLISYEADINIPTKEEDNNTTALGYAVSNDNIEIVDSQLQ